jgi:hypothetical protein
VANLGSFAGVGNNRCSNQKKSQGLLFIRHTYAECMRTSAYYISIKKIKIKAPAKYTDM